MRYSWMASAFAIAMTALPLAAQAAPDDTLRIGLREDPDILDPTLGSSYVGRIVYAAMCEKLFDLDTKLNIIPQLATGYQYEDPTHLVIKLRQGVTFQDGEPLTADAAKFSLMRHLTAKGSMRAGEINAIQSIEVVDPLTIRLVLKAPNSLLLAQLTDRAGMMLSPKAVQAEGDNFWPASGLRRALCVRQPRRAGPHRAEALSRLLGRAGFPFRPGHLSADDELLGAAGELAGGRGRSRGVHRADRRAGGTERS